MTVPEASVPNTRSLTRSATLETALESLDVLAFDEDSTLVYTTRGRAIEIEKRSGKTYAKATIRFKIIDEDLFFVFLGNVQSELYQLISDGKVKTRDNGTPGTGYRELIELLTFDCPQAKPTTAFPMWGHTQEYFNIKNAPTGGSDQLFKDKPIYMLRSIAKVDVYYSPKIATDILPNGAVAGKNYADYFELTSVHIVNVPENGLAIPRLENIETRVDKILADKPSLHKDFIASPGTYNWISSSDVDPQWGQDQHGQDIMAIVDQLYITENSTLDRSLDEKTCIIIGGKYNKNGTGNFTGIDTTYYRVDFIDELANYLPIKRNFKYSLTISVIDNEGAVDIDKAIDGPSLNIETKVLEWEDLNMEEVYYDGYYRYYVSPRRSYQTAPEAFDVLATTIVTDSRYTDIRVRYPEDDQGNPILPKFIKTAAPYAPRIANQTIDAEGTTTAELLISLDEYDAENAVGRIDSLEIVFYDLAGNLKVVVPVHIIQESRFRDFQIDDYKILPIISSPYEDAKLYRAIPDSVWIIVDGTFQNAYFKIQINGLSSLGDFTGNIFSGTIIKGYNQYEEETGDNTYSGWSSVKAPNPSFGTGGWAFTKGDNAGYPIIRSPNFNYDYYFRVNDNLQWPGRSERMTYQGYYMQLDTWPEETGTKDETTVRTTTLPATGAVWNVKYLGYWYHKVTLSVRDGLDVTSNEVGRLDIYPADQSDYTTWTPILSIPVDDNEDNAPRELHMWFSPTGKDSDMRPCISLEDHWGWRIGWYIFPVTQEF